jgi:hypothetical protein
VVEQVGDNRRSKKIRAFERRFGFCVIHKHTEREIQLRILKS